MPRTDQPADLVYDLLADQDDRDVVIGRKRLERVSDLLDRRVCVHTSNPSQSQESQDR